MLKKKMHTVKAQEKRFEKEKENLTPLPDVEEAIFLEFPPGGSLPRTKTLLCGGTRRCYPGRKCQ